MGLLMSDRPLLRRGITVPVHTEQQVLGGGLNFCSRRPPAGPDAPDQAAVAGHRAFVVEVRRAVVGERFDGKVFTWRDFVWPERNPPCPQALGRRVVHGEHPVEVRAAIGLLVAEDDRSQSHRWRIRPALLTRRSPLRPGA